ncbi:hypothetical protein AB5I41_03190 [Sphingomonas sp. MMS24-JH45]
MQRARQGTTNAELEGVASTASPSPTRPGASCSADAAAAMGLSARGYTRVLRVARTIADLSGAGGSGAAARRRSARVAAASAGRLTK